MTSDSKPDLRTLLTRIGLWLVVMWLAVLTISYYALRNPFVGAAAGVTLNNVLDALAVASLMTLAGAAGGLILRELDQFSPLEQTAFRALTGLAAISLTVLVLGLVGWYPPGWSAWLITLAGLAILHRPALRWLLALRDGLGQALRGREAVSQQGLFNTIISRVVIAALLALLVMAIAPAFAPVTEWDSLVYHVAGPRLYITSGRIVALPELHFLGFPFLTEMLYLWLMLMARPQAAALLHAAFGLLMLMLVIGMARRLNRPMAGWLAALALLVNTEIQHEFGVPFSDLSAAAYATAALWLALAAYPDEGPLDTRYLLWAGVFAGFTLGTKYTTAGAMLAVGLITLWPARRQGVGRMLRAGALLALPALAVFAPWMIKNLLLYGNPVAPFIWGTLGFDRLDLADYLDAGSGLSGVRLITVPVTMAFLGGLGDWKDLGTPGPLLAGLLPLAVVGWRMRPQAERRFIKLAVTFGAVGLFVWLVGAATSIYLVSFRLLFPFFPAAALVAGLGLDGLREAVLPIPVYRISRLLVLLTALIVPLLAALALLADPRTLRVSLGMQTAQDYLTESLPAYYTAIRQVNTLPSEARVLLLWESRTFYCTRVCVPDTLLNRWRHDLRLEPDPHQIAQQWREKGITHVLISEAGMNAMLHATAPGILWLTSEDITALDAVRKADLKLLWDDSTELGAYSLYALR